MNNILELKLNSKDKADKFTNLANEFKSNIDVIRDKHVIDGKSMLGIYTIDLNKPVKVRINSDDIEEINRFNKQMEKFKW